MIDRANQKLTANQQKILDSINRVTGSETVKGYINTFVEALAAKNNEQYSNWEMFKIVIKNTIFSADFWSILFNHFSDLINLIKCTYDTEYKEALGGLSDEIANNNNIKSFLEDLGNNKDKITSAISYMMDLPDHSEQGVLDKTFMSQVVTFLGENQSKITDDDIRDITKLLIERKAIELKLLTGFDKKAASDSLFMNNLAFTSLMLEILGKIKGIDVLVGSKETPIAKFLAENLTLNGVTGVMTQDGFKKVIVEILSNDKIRGSFGKLKEIVDTFIQKNQIANELAKFQYSGQEITTQKASLESFIKEIIGKSSSVNFSENDIKNFQNEISKAQDKERLDKVKAKIEADIGQKYVMKMSQSGVEMIGDLPDTLDGVKAQANHGLFFSQLFSAESKDSKIKYTLSPMDQSLLSFGFMKFKDRNHGNFLGLQTDEQKQAFMSAWSLEVNGKDALDKAQFEVQILSNFDVQLLVDVLPTMTPEAMKGFGDFLALFNQGKPMFEWMPILLKTMAENKDLQSVLVKYKTEVTEFIKKITPEEAMVQFKLEKDTLLKEGFIGDMMGAIDVNAAKGLDEFFGLMRKEGSTPLEWMPKLFEIVANNPRLKNKLVAHKDVVAYFAKQMTPDSAFDAFTTNTAIDGEWKNNLFQPSFIGDMMEAMTPQVATQFGGFMSDLQNEMPIFAWMPKMLQAAATNNHFAKCLVEHKETISYLAGQMSEKAVKNFGLSKDFMNKIVINALKDEKSISFGYNIFCALASESYSEMVKYAFQLLGHNEGLRDLLSKSETQKEVGALMEALSVQNDTIKEYFGRFEFGGLKTGINPIMIDVMPAIVKLLNSDGDKSLISTLDNLMDNNGIPDGIGFSKEVFSVVDHKGRDKALDSIYLYLAGAKKFDDIKADLVIIGIKSEDELKEKIEEGRVNDSAFKLCNGVLAVFKADLPEDKPELITEEERAKYRSHVETIKTRQSAELQVMIEIINGDKNVFDAIDKAVTSGKISEKNATFLKKRFNEHNLNDKKELLQRLSYELRIKLLESLGVEKQNGIVVSSTNSSVFFQLSRRLNGALEANADITRDQLKTLIESNTDVLSQDQIKLLLDVILNNKGTASKTEVLDLVNDFACRRRGAESIGKTQDLLNSVFAPFAALTKLPYGIDLKELNFAIEKLEDKDYSSEEIQTFLSDNLPSCSNLDAFRKDIIEKDAVVIVDNNNERIASQTQAELKAKLSSVKADYTKIIEVLNKILNKISDNKDLLSIIETKGNDKASVIEQLKNVITGLEKEDRIVMNKLIVGISSQMIGNSYYVNAIKETLKKIEDPANDKELERVLDFIIGTLSQGVLLFSAKNPVEALKLLIGKGVQAGYNYLAVDLPQNPKTVIKFNRLVEDLKNKGSPVNIRGILRSDFQPTSVHTLSKQNLGNLDLSNSQGLDGISFFETNLKDVIFNNVSFINCTFYKSDLPSVANLDGATFDIASFTTFIANAEAKNIDILPYLQSNIRITTNVSQSISPHNAYILIKAAKEKGVPLSDAAILDTVKPNGTHSLLDAGFSNLSHLKFRGLPEILEAWYKQRASDSMNTSEKERNRNLSPEVCLTKAAAYKSKVADPLASDMTKLIASKLCGYRYLSVPDRLDDAEKIYNAIYDNLAKLSADEKSKMKANLAVVVENIYNSLYKISKYEKSNVSRAVFIPADKANNIASIVTIEFLVQQNQAPEMLRQVSHEVTLAQLELLRDKDKILELMIEHCGRTKTNAADVISKITEFEKVLEIIKSSPDLEVHRDELYRLDIGVLNVITKNPQVFAERSKIDIKPVHIWNSKDNSFHNQMYKLSSEDLQFVLKMEDDLFNWCKTFSGKTLSDILSDKDKLNEISRILVLDNSLKNDVGLLYGFALENLKLIDGNNVNSLNAKLLIARQNGIESQLNSQKIKDISSMSDDIFGKMASYCKRSGKTLDEMMDRKDVLQSLESLSKEFEDRYKLSGKTGSEKFCLNLVVKFFNQSPEPVQQLLNNATLHTLIADIGFNAVEREKIDPTNLEQVESFAKTISEKINSNHTADLGNNAIEQGKKIAEAVFEKLNVASYLKGETEKSKSNFANIIASRIFASGKAIDEKDLDKVIGEVKPNTGYFTSKYSQSTGVVKLFLNTYGTTLSYNYVNKFDAKLTNKLIVDLDELISNKNLSQSKLI